MVFKISWSDIKRFRLEERLGEVLEGFRRFAAYELARRSERERADQESAVIQARIEELRAQREGEKRRLEKLEVDSCRWHDAQRIRAFVEATKQTRGPDNEWISWALKHAD